MHVFSLQTNEYQPGERKTCRSVVKTAFPMYELSTRFSTLQPLSPHPVPPCCKAAKRSLGFVALETALAVNDAVIYINDRVVYINDGVVYQNSLTDCSREGTAHPFLQNNCCRRNARRGRHAHILSPPPLKARELRILRQRPRPSDRTGARRRFGERWNTSTGSSGNRRQATPYS